MELAPGRFETRRLFRQMFVLLVSAFAGLLSLRGEDKPVTVVREVTHRVPLSAGQIRAISLLRQVRPEKPAPLFLFTDPNKDPDDLSVLVETKYLQEQGFLDLRCAVTTLGNRDVRTTRARFTRSVLDELGLENSTVGVGVDYGFEVKDASGVVDAKATAGREKDHRVFVETPLLRPLAVVEPDGLAMLKKELQLVGDHSAVLVVNAGMADLAELLRDAPDLVKRKAARVVIMGGVEPQLDSRKFVVADKRAYNNSTHQPSADYVYARVQELGVPLVVVNKEATYSAAAPRGFYDGIAATKHPVGVYLKEQQKQSLKHLWEGIHQGHLPPALTPSWFFQTFTDVDLDSSAGKVALAQATAHAEDFEEIWKQVSKFNLYDPLALLAATPGAAEMLFQSEVPAGAKSRVQIIGKSSIKDATLIKDLLAGLGIESLNPSQRADAVFRNGAVYTVDAARSWAEAVAVRGGRIVYVGADVGLAPWIGPQTRSVDLQGKMLLPGFHDSHVHLVGGGIELDECDLNGLVTLDEVLAKVREFAEKHPEKKWIRGGGWPLTLNGGNPHKELLDKIVADRPVILDAFDGHSSWVNSRALEIAGITKETPDPVRGRIERDPKTGEPTGTLRESAARLVIVKTPPYSHEEFVRGLRRGLEMANRFGITSVQEAQVSDQHLKAFQELDRAGELTVRTVAAMRFDPAKGMAQIPQFVEWRTKFQSQRLRTTAVKIFQDGVIESRTAALLQPYLGSEREERGWVNFEPEVFKPVAAELDRLGFQIHVHAIGDRAIQSSFDALEFAQARNGRRDSRHHLAHIQLFDPPDIARFRRLGVVANFQPLWAWADPYIVDMTLPVLGPERSRWLYPIRSVASSGAVIACGSDWSVSSMNPLDAIQVAVTRRGLKEKPGLAWIPEEAVDLPLMIAGYTINGAYVNFEETETGSIEVGKAADLIVLDRNLFEVPAHEIHLTKVLLTLLEGKEVYRDAGFPAAVQ